MAMTSVSHLNKPSRRNPQTLSFRACALTRYVEWFFLLNHRGSPLILKEFDIYSYLGHLESGKAGATAASSFLETLRFLDSVAVLTCADLGLLLSMWVSDFAHQQFLRKAPLKQKDPMPCLVVAELEEQRLIGVVESQEETVGRKPFPGEQEVSCIVHRQSGIVHGLASSGATTLCSRHVSANYVALERAAIYDMECCIWCGRNIAA